MTMLYNFFQPDVDKATGEIFYNKKSKKYLFQNLKIKDAYLNYDPVSKQKIETKLIDCQGSFPVINIVFGGDIQTDPQDVDEYFKYMIASAFKEHSYLLNVKNILVGQNREIFEKIVCDRNFEGYELTKSLYVLIYDLNKHYNRNVVVLIDGYDRHLMNLAAADSPIYNYALDLTTSFFSPLKFNTKIIQLAVLTGESRVAKWEISIENALKKLKYTEKFEKLLIDGYIKFENKNFFSFKSMHDSEYKFLSFLVDAGYLTTINDKIFTIPNNEAKDYFYNDLLKVWLKKIHEDLDLEKMKNFNIEDCKEYTESFQKHVLNKMRYPQLLESDFKKLIVLPYIASI